MVSLKKQIPLQWPFKNTKADWDADFFNIVSQVDTLAQYLFLIYLERQLF